MKKKILGLTLIGVLAFTGCSSEQTDIGFVTSTGGINDGSFNEGTWNGITEYAEEYDKTADYIETKESGQLVQNLNASASLHEVVVASGFDMANPVYNSAMANPETDYVLIDAIPTNDNGEEVELDNVHSYLFEEYDAGWLVGYVAGKTTESDKIGFIGGMNIPTCTPFEEGYKDGAEYANNNVEVMSTYTGSFSDVATAKTTAQAFVNKDVDIIFTAAGGGNSGIIEVAKESGIQTIGVDSDMYEDGIMENGESVVLTSAMKRVDEGAYEGLSMHFNGTFEGGTTRLTMAEGGVGLPEENPNLEDSLVKEAYDAYGDFNEKK